MFGIFHWIVVNWVQVLGVLTGGGSVFYLARNWGKTGWAFGIINAVFFVILFFPQHLYGDVMLNSYYFITSSLGLWWWLKGGQNRTALKISRLDKKGWFWTIFWVLVGTLVIGYVLNTYTNAAFAFVDMFTTSLSFVAQYLLAKKKFENWYLWILADVIDLWLYTVKGLPLVTVLTAVYMVFCVMGIIEWRRVERKEKAVELPAAPTQPALVAEVV